MLASERSGLIAPMVIGIGLGGFFDGILLHQVLQWHHLLSLVDGEAFRDIQVQIFADGLFHVLMYAVTALGLWLLWRRRHLLASPMSGGWRTVAGGGLLGFGLWNIIDVGFFHWILGIHRIRVDVPDPLAYDLGWLAAFGILPIAAALQLLRTRGGRGGAAAAGTMALLALLMAPLAARPAPGSNTAVVFFAPGSGPARAINAAAAADARIIWLDPVGRAMVVAPAAASTVSRLYGSGAAFVTRSPAVAGCVAAVRA
jgi:uncharacterized membrane protein